METELKHPYVKELFKHYRRLKKKIQKIQGTKAKLQDKGGDKS